MSQESAQLFGLYGFFIALLAVTGIYCLLATRNLIRLLIGLELLMKAVTLLIIVAGSLTAHEALAQSLVITLIVIEVVLMVVMGGVILNVFRHRENISTNELNNLKG
jgi:multisubunit Na+/H+ antiporter MnhC subunit